MDRRPLGSTGLMVTPIGFGAFKIGRNQGIKYAQGYALPDDDDVRQLLEAVRELGIAYIDTAPAYGVSEDRLGTLMPRGFAPVISTKVGERFVDGVPMHDFSRAAVVASIDASCRALHRDKLDLVFIHSDGRDLKIQSNGETVETLRMLKETGRVRAIGFSGKTVEGADEALSWADAIMVEYHLEDRSHEAVMLEAHERGIGVVVKKGLASGSLGAAEAIEFVLSNPTVDSLVIGALSIEHLRENVETARHARRRVP